MSKTESRMRRLTACWQVLRMYGGCRNSYRKGNYLTYELERIGQGMMREEINEASSIMDGQENKIKAGHQKLWQYCNASDIPLLPGERVDDLQRNNLRIIQNEEKFCFGMDAVLLSGFAKVKPGEQVLDLGTGTGIIPILLSAKTPAKHLTALEIQEESADMARRSVALNELQEKIEVVTGDIKEASALFGKAVFDVVTSNPPYMNDQHGLKNQDLPKAIARHEVLCSLEDVVREASAVLKPNGRFYMVHRPFRLAEIFAVLQKYKLEPKSMRLVHPFIDKEPNMVLLECLKGGKSMIKIAPPLIVYKEPGVYMPEIYEVYGY